MCAQLKEITRIVAFRQTNGDTIASAHTYLFRAFFRAQLFNAIGWKRFVTAKCRQHQQCKCQTQQINHNEITEQWNTFTLHEERHFPSLHTSFPLAAEQRSRTLGFQFTCTFSTGHLLSMWFRCAAHGSYAFWFGLLLVLFFFRFAQLWLVTNKWIFTLKCAIATGDRWGEARGSTEFNVA